MTVVHVIAVVFGAALVMSVLISALETVVLPMRGFTRITRVVFTLADWALLHRWKHRDREIRIRGLYAPVALVTLPLVWMLLVSIGFSVIFWGFDTGTWQHCFEVSGSSLTTLGFAAPAGPGRTWLSIVEAIIGLGLVALLITYLPTIYSAYHSREKGIIVMRPFAGLPPSPLAMLSTLHRFDALGNSELWRMNASWLLDLEQTHTSFPALCYFPESVAEQSWVASVGALLDAVALLICTDPFQTLEDVPNEMKGPLLVLIYGIPAIGQVGRTAGLPIEPTTLSDLVAAAPKDVPLISIRRDEFDSALDGLDDVLHVASGDRDACWRRFARIRSGYDRALRGLAGLTLASTAIWTTDRPARVGRPRLLRSDPVAVDWSLPPAEAPRRSAGAG